MPRSASYRRFWACLLLPALLVAACTTSSPGAASVGAAPLTGPAGSAQPSVSSPAGPVAQPVSSTGLGAPSSATGSATVPAGSKLGSATVPGRSTPAPAPPPPMTLTGSSAAQAAQLAAAFTKPASAAAVVALYQAANVPVVNTGGSFTTPGQLGAPWPAVWAVSEAARPGGRVSLTAVASILTADPALEPSSSAPTIAADLLSALRANLHSPHPNLALAANLVSVEARNLGGVDMAAAGITPDQVSVSVPTAGLLVWAALLAGASTAPRGQGLHAANPSFLQPADDGPFGINCDPDDNASWAVWILSKVTGGVAIGAAGWDGVFPLYIKQLQAAFNTGGVATETVSKLIAGIGAVKDLAGAFAASATAATTIAARYSATATGKLGNNPFQRTRNANPGKTPP